MIRSIAAVDSKLGIADEHGIPWQGKLPTEVKYYYSQIEGQTLLMGHRVYQELQLPPKNSKSYVITSFNEPLRPGFTKIIDLEQFFQDHEDVWIIGGAIVFAETMHKTDELYVTRVEGDFGCTKFFPAFETEFERVKQSSPQTENGITFQFEVWRRKAL